MRIELTKPPMFMVLEARERGIVPGATITDGTATGVVWPVEDWFVGTFGDMACADGDGGVVYGYDRNFQRWAKCVELPPKNTEEKEPKEGS